MRTLPPLAADALLAVAVFGTGVAATAGQDPTAAELAISAAMCAPLAARRVAPVAAFAAVLVCAAVSLVVSDRVITGDPAVLIALYSLVAYAPGDRLRAIGLAVVLVGAIPTGLRWSPLVDWEAGANVGIVVVHLLLAAALGQLRRDALRRAADRLAQAAADERTRIARELHDVVAHALAVVVVQADGGRFAARADPAAAEGALETIGSTARAALVDMRAALGTLREDAQPSIGDLGALTDRLAVAFVVTGTPREVNAAAGLAVYRVVQEALTNVIKHAGDGARGQVELNYGEKEVTVTITDNGGGSAAGAEGYGLRGMRERVAHVGGTLAAGPGDNGGWRVTARIPT